MIKIPLTGRTENLFALIDDEDWPLVYSHDWLAVKNKRHHTFYAQTTTRDHTLMHQMILGVAGVDHRNGNGLDNQKRNLRGATQSQNGANIRRIRGSSGYKGVFFHKECRKWRAMIRVNRKLRHLGLFDSPAAAAAAYDAAAKEAFGAFAATNAELRGEKTDART